MKNRFCQITLDLIKKSQTPQNNATRDTKNRVIQLENVQP